MPQRTKALIVKMLSKNSAFAFIFDATNSTNINGYVLYVDDQDRITCGKITEIIQIKTTNIHYTFTTTRNKFIYGNDSEGLKKINYVYILQENNIQFYKNGNLPYIISNKLQHRSTGGHLIGGVPSNITHIRIYNHSMGYFNIEFKTLFDHNYSLNSVTYHHISHKIEAGGFLFFEPNRNLPINETNVPLSVTSSQLSPSSQSLPSIPSSLPSIPSSSPSSPPIPSSSPSSPPIPSSQQPNNELYNKMELLINTHKSQNEPKINVPYLNELKTHIKTHILTKLQHVTIFNHIIAKLKQPRFLFGKLQILLGDEIYNQYITFWIQTIINSKDRILGCFSQLHDNTPGADKFAYEIAYHQISHNLNNIINTNTHDANINLLMKILSYALREMVNHIRDRIFYCIIFPIMFIIYKHILQLILNNLRQNINVVQSIKIFGELFIDTKNINISDISESILVASIPFYYETEYNFQILFESYNQIKTLLETHPHPPQHRGGSRKVKYFRLKYFENESYV